MQDDTSCLLKSIKLFPVTYFLMFSRAKLCNLKTEEEVYKAKAKNKIDFGILNSSVKNRDFIPRHLTHGFFTYTILHFYI